MKRATVAAALLMLVFGPARTSAQGTTVRAGVSAADSVLDARTSALAATLRCPVCQGESIQDSPATLAVEMRAVVRDQLREGKSEDEIKAYFVSKYGEWILLEPTMTGLNVALYAFPVVLVLGGLAVIAILVRRWSTPNPNDQPAP